MELRVTRIVIGTETVAPAMAPMIADHSSDACALKKLTKPLSPFAYCMRATGKINHSVHDTSMAEGHSAVVGELDKARYRVAWWHLSSLAASRTDVPSPTRRSPNAI